MIRQNKWKLMISSIIILLPWLMRMGEDSFIGNISPWFILVIHWICVVFTAADPRNKEQSRKAFDLIFWACPVSSVYVYLTNNAISSGKEFTAEIISQIGIGLMFVVIGNYLPKCRQNYTIGIKISWTLQDEENWNRTHRFGGKVWMAGGMLMILSPFLPDKLAKTLIPTVMLILIMVPIVYSYLYSRKQKKEGTFGMRESDTQTKEMLQKNKKITKIGIGIVCMIFAACGVLMFSGRITYVCDDHVLRIEADYWDDLEIAYDKIEAIEFRETGDPGSRVAGFGSARLLMGNFRNDEFGYYTRYSYTGKGACIVLTVDERTLVLGSDHAEATRALFEQLERKVAGDSVR